MNLDWVLLGFWSCSLPSHAVSFLCAALRVVLVLKGVHSNKRKSIHFCETYFSRNVTALFPVLQDAKDTASENILIKCRVEESLSSSQASQVLGLKTCSLLSVHTCTFCGKSV